MSKLLGACVLLAAALPAAADGLDALVSEGKAGLELRYRFEGVEQEGVAQDAAANTVRLRLNLASGRVAGFSGFVEFDHLEALGTEKYNSTRNGQAQYPVVADPEGTDLNQLYLRYDGFAGTVVKFGRQRLVLDNQRFIGNVGWRQNEQTYDAVSIQNKSLRDTTLTYAYLDNVRRVFGPDDGSPPAEFDSRSHVLHAAYTGWRLGTLSLYNYHLDLRDAPALATNTLGLRLDGGLSAAGGRLGWKAEYAHQTDVGRNPQDLSTDYWLLEASFQREALGIALGYEVLGGTAGVPAGAPNPAFQTPLATLHAFQGWADKFLTTPAAGIEDFYVSLRGGYGKLKGELTWHDFSAEATTARYGSELNLSLSYPLGERYVLLAKFADYSADALFTDTRKYWLQFAATF